MDDLISRKALAEWIHANVSADTPDALITKSFVMAALSTKSITPSVPAVPLEMISKKLGSLCKPCIFQIGCPYKSFDCDSCNTSDAWEKAIIKWMEEEDAQKEN